MMQFIRGNSDIVLGCLIALVCAAPFFIIIWLAERH
ncbi:hypothetical protein ACI0FR_00035 [Paenochrobactrum sp. BZR 201-1]